MRTYDHNTTRHTEYSEVRQYFWYAIFMLCLIWGALEQRYESDDSPKEESKSIRDDIKTTQSIEIADTTIEYKPVFHIDPLLGRTLKY